MTLHAPTEFSIPEETIRVARAAYPYGNTLMKMRDALGTIYQEQSFVSLFPHNVNMSLLLIGNGTQIR